MGVETTKMYTVKCNMCMKRIEPDMNGFNCYNDKTTAFEKAEEYGWKFYGNKCYCPKCQLKRDPNKIQIIKDNFGNEVEVFQYLEIGEKVICIKDKNGTGGDFIPFPMKLLKKDQIYTVRSISRWSFSDVPCVIDDDGNTTWVTKEYFKLTKNMGQDK